MTKIRVFVNNTYLARMRTDATCMRPWFLETKYGAKKYKTPPRNKHVKIGNCQTNHPMPPNTPPPQVPQPQPNTPFTPPPPLTPQPKKRRWLLIPGVIVLLGAVFVAANLLTPSDDQATMTGEISNPDETQYLVFGIPADVYDPAKDVHGNLDKQVTSLINRLDTTGDSKHRLGFMIVLPVWFSDSRMGGDQAHIEKIIKEAFAVAKSRDMAVYFTFYSFTRWPAQMWNWYDSAQPGYNPENKKNVEWTDWSGTPTKNRYSLQEGETRMAPVMCYNSPTVLSEVSYIISKVVGPAILRGIADLKSAGKEDLFGGITVSEELSLDDYSGIDKLNPTLAAMMTKDGAKKARLGYCALTNAGFSASNPPANYADALAKINQDYAAYWGKQLVEAGISKSKLYTHVAPATEAAYLQYTNAPIDTAFNEYSNPGWTTYIAGPLTKGLDVLYKALAEHGNPSWGSTESSPTNITGTKVEPETFLAWHYNHGATLIVMNAADSSGGGQLLGKDMWSSKALAAYKKFLSGLQLQE